MPAWLVLVRAVFLTVNKYILAVFPWCKRERERDVMVQMLGIRENTMHSIAICFHLFH
jgi:hypothetical protein